MDVFIYSLTDPRTGEIRYVGKAMDVNIRYSRHLQTRDKSHKTNWIKSLLKLGLKPEMEILESFYCSDDNDWQESERWWISYLRFIGCNLTNMDLGGTNGKKHSAETRAKIGVKHKGKTVVITDSTRAKIGNYHRGKKRSQSTRIKMSAAMAGKPKSESHKARLSEVRKEMWKNPEMKAVWMQGFIKRRNRQREDKGLPPWTPELALAEKRQYLINWRANKAAHS